MDNELGVIWAWWICQWDHTADLGQDNQKLWEWERITHLKVNWKE